jgi:signal transduction histidine kinase
MVKADSNENDFRLSITNFSDQIPEEAMAQLFQPFSRGKVKPGQEGLGLGLYISAEIARAHRGKLEVISNDKETCFTLQIPVDPQTSLS